MCGVGLIWKQGEKVIWLRVNSALSNMAEIGVSFQQVIDALSYGMLDKCSL